MRHPRPLPVPPTTVQASRDSWFTTQLAEALAVALDASCSSVSQLTMARDLRSASQFGHARRLLQLLLSHTTLCSVCTLCLNTLMSLSCMTTRHFMTFVVETWTSNDLRTQI